MLNEDIRTHRVRMRVRTKALPPISRAHARVSAPRTRTHALPEFREQYAHAHEGRVFRVHKKGGASKSTIVILLFLESIKRGARQEGELASRLFFRHRAPVSAPAREKGL